jgi:hypothetical protein
LYTNTTHLEVNVHVDVVKPGKTLEIPIIFYPRESINYRELIPFEINGLSQQIVEIKGKGTEMKVRDNEGGPWTWLLPSPPSQVPSTSLSLGLLYQLSTNSTEIVVLITQRRELSNQTQVNHISYSIPDFSISKNTDTRETFYVFLERFEIIRCGIPSTSSSSHTRACFFWGETQ